MLKLDTLADLVALGTHQVPESNTLEYKASPAAENTEPRRLEISKDISAMANAEGGQFVYAMTEANHLPAGLDEGINPTKFDGLWFEQVVQQNIKPIIEDLKIRQIQLGNSNVATVIDVPKSRTVHQAKDGRYYRRRNFRNDIMEDYEIREALNRATKPELYLRMGLAQNPTTLTLPVEGSGVTSPFGLHAAIGNKSSQPSFYTVVHLFADTRLQGGPSGFEPASPTQTNTLVAVNRWVSKLGVPGHFPIFSETEFSILQSPWQLTMPAELIDNHEEFTVGYLILSPGFTGQSFGKLILQNRTITFVMDALPV